MYYRDYTPEYPRSNETYEELIATILRNREYCIVPNDAPYNKYKGETVETKHFVLYYNKGGEYYNAKSQHIRNEIQHRIANGYAYQEQATDDKSVDIPHIHLIKKL